MTPRAEGRARFLVAPAAILLAAGLFGVASPGFLSLDNGLSMAGQIWILALLAVGQMFAIAARGFDISVGAVAALSGTLGAMAANAIGLPGLLLAVPVGLACGTVNGWLIGRARFQPIVATLGTLLAVKGLALLVSDDGQVVPLEAAARAAALSFDAVAGLPPLGWAALAAVGLAHVVLRHMLVGRRILMLGSNPEAVALVGAVPWRIEMSAYQLCGAFAGLAGALMTARAGAGLPTEGAGMELQSIAAAVIGGTVLAGGRANVWAVLAGATFVQVVLTGLNLSGVSPFIAQIAVGAVILASGLMDAGLRTLLTRFSRLSPPKGTFR
ncbi:ribose transport system permease protein [Angulomicrobium tetraedrale]|uniref:Ribose transport system permease protein n=1 Tax=Ancylobacter tetraedralis TaxID=217068 RepID=A0A839ZFQ7_9HYPH|nr:ABC transporter permease [Ancylobacter tetraedralis]MBB3773663.1 ribose transport system permease protein [Ancylobacter tetraedralis]